ncbi:MAG: hypothetical protein KME31_13650 [Tolypothrix carrinoi HA7290-LM1]|nr:hypothetical protein [Tolypothrix carrinoi HA7290-LM1]
MVHETTSNQQPFGFVRCFKSGNPPNALTHHQLSTNNPSGSSDASSRETRPTH